MSITHPTLAHSQCQPASAPFQTLFKVSPSLSLIHSPFVGVMSISRVKLASALLVLAVCALLSVASADTCSFTLYSDNTCYGSAVSKMITLNGLSSSFGPQCVVSTDGLTSQSISHYGSGTNQNISYSYFQVSRYYYHHHHHTALIGHH